MMASFDSINDATEYYYHYRQIERSRRRVPRLAVKSSIKLPKGWSNAGEHRSARFRVVPRHSTIPLLNRKISSRWIDHYVLGRFIPFKEFQTFENRYINAYTGAYTHSWTHPHAAHTYTQIYICIYFGWVRIKIFKNRKWLNSKQTHMQILVYRWNEYRSVWTRERMRERKSGQEGKVEER